VAASRFNPNSFDPHDPAFLADPYPTYALFRAQAPVHNVKPYSSDWIFTYADCQQVLTDTDTWVKNSPLGEPPNPGPYEMMANFPPGLFGSDPPLHTQLRSLLEPLFDEAIKVAPALATQIGQSLLTTARQRGRIELISDYALPLPSGVLFTLLGIPNDPLVWSGLITWQAVIAAAHDKTQSLALRGTGATCSMALNSFFEGMLLGNRHQPEAGLFAQICQAFADAGLSPQQIQMVGTDFLVAGYLSTTFIIGTGIRNLLQNPDQMQSLRDQPSLIGGAVEEMLRFDAPAQLADRCAAVRTELGGRKFAPGARVTLVLGSADHDPSAFTTPDKFVIKRKDRAHLSFGAGIHYCIGAPLVRLVAPIAIEMLLGEFPQLALDGVPQWQTDPYMRAVTNLPLRF
jgi:cytochrome P450